MPVSAKKKEIKAIKELIDSNQYDLTKEGDIKKISSLTGVEIERLKTILSLYDKFIVAAGLNDKQKMNALSIYDQVTIILQKVYFDVKSKINKIKDFDKEIFDKLDKTVNEVKTLAQDNKNYAESELKNKIVELKQTVDGYKKDIVNRQDEAIKEKNINLINAYQTAFDGCSAMVNNLRMLIQSNNEQKGDVENVK